MDPLSVTASIVGILGAAGKVAEVLGSVVTNIKDAPRVFTTITTEVNSLRIVLSSLQQFLVNLTSASPHRVALIQLDQLIVTLTDSVLTFSELETLITPLDVPPGCQFLLKDRLKWLMKESAILGISEKLQKHMSSLSLMLNILQWYAANLWQFCNSPLP